MHFDRRSILRGAAAMAALASWPRTSFGQTRAETLRYVTGNNVNTLDPSVPGSTRESFGLSMNVYDRLFSFGRKRLDGNWVFDATTIRGELAQGYQISPDGLKITILLRPDATWHDGSPVTAEDIKWSLDRSVSAKSKPTIRATSPNSWPKRRGRIRWMPRSPRKTRKCCSSRCADGERSTAITPM